MTTPILQLTEVAGSQSQPHIPINAALRALEIFSQVVVTSILDTPPGSPADGDAYIVDDGASGDWAGQDGAIAYYSGGWLFLAPRLGWKAFNLDDASEYRYEDASPNGWTLIPGGGSIDAADVSYDGSLTVEDALNADGDALAELLKIGIPYAQPGTPSDGATYHIMAPYAFTIPAALVGTHAYAGVAATVADADFSLSKNGAAAFGTIRFESGGGVTLIAASDTSFVPGDRLTITAPSPQNATLANVGFTIYARRSV